MSSGPTAEAVVLFGGRGRTSPVRPRGRVRFANRAQPKPPIEPSQNRLEVAGTRLPSPHSRRLRSRRSW